MAVVKGVKEKVHLPLYDSVSVRPKEQLGKILSSNVLRFKTDQALPSELAAQARVTGRVVQLPAHNAIEVEQWLARAREAGVVAEDVEIRKADLEDVFIEVMERASGQAHEATP